LTGKLAEDVAKELIAGTKLRDVDIRKKYIDGGIDAVDLSDDPMIKLALLVDPLSRGLRKKYETEGYWQKRFCSSLSKLDSTRSTEIFRYLPRNHAPDLKPYWHWFPL